MTEANIVAGRLVVSVVITLVQRLGFNPRDPTVAEHIRNVLSNASQLGRTA